MRRRKFLGVLSGAAAWPLTARAQQAMPVVGFVNGQSAGGFAPYAAAFHQGLKDAGYVVGQNAAIEYRWAEGQFDRLPALAAELASRRVNVMVATGGGVFAARAMAGSDIPTVFLSGGDPVALGLVSSMNRPSGNLTGVAMFTYSLGPKRLEVLREAIPNAKTIAVLTNPSNNVSGARSDLQSVQTTAQAVGQKINVVDASNAGDIDAALSAIARRRDDALLVMGDPFFNSRREQIVALAARHAIPAVYEWREFATAGGLASYGASITDAYRQVGVYTGRILKGAKPADLPIMQTVKIELVLNLKTAKALGVTFPITLLGRADEVIE
jgi:putative ABC transport system substrate-binding protein